MKRGEFWKGRKHSEETKKKMSLFHKGKSLSEEHKKNISLATKGKLRSEETKKKISESHKGEKNYNFGKHLSEIHRKNISINLIGKTLGRKHTEEQRRKNSEAHKGEKHNNFGKHLSEITKEKIRLTKIGEKNPMFGKNFSEEHRNKISKSGKGRKFSKETRQKIRETTKELWKKPNYRINHREKWNDEEFRNKWIKQTLKGLLKRPTSFEQKIADLCFKYNLPFVYKGDGGFLINFKNPDFVNEKDKVVIEVFYSWFKIRDYGSVDNYKQFCREKYNPAGWSVIFIDETEIDVENWEEICLNKITKEVKK